MMITYEDKITVYVGTELKRAIGLVCAYDGVSKSEFTRMLIKKYISENKEKYENVLRDIDWS